MPKPFTLFALCPHNSTSFLSSPAESRKVLLQSSSSVPHATTSRTQEKCTDYNSWLLVQKSRLSTLLIPSSLLQVNTDGLPSHSEEIGLTTNVKSSVEPPHHLGRPSIRSLSSFDQNRVITVSPIKRFVDWDSKIIKEGLHEQKILEKNYVLRSKVIKVCNWLRESSGEVLRGLQRSYSVIAATTGCDCEDGENSLRSNTSSSGGLLKSPVITLEKDRQSSTPFQDRAETVSVSSSSTVPATNMKEERQLEFIMKSLVSGGVAGMCAKTSVAPLDRMKILLQAHSKHYSHLGVFSGLKGIVKKERFLALYKGNGAQMVRIFPYAATQFTSFEMYKKLFGETSHVARFAAGSAAGVTAVALTYPLDTIRARLAFQVTGEDLYTGIYSCAVHILREEGGVRALYRGFIPTICGMIPYAGLSFYCFESFKYICMKYFPTYTCKSHSTNTGGLVLLLYAKLLCGGVAGAAAQTVSYPLDVTRRRMQLAMMDEKTKKFGMGMVSTLKLIYQENGVIRGLYRGMSINYLRAIPMVAVSFSTYELVKQMLHLDTGLPIKTG